MKEYEFKFYYPRLIECFKSGTMFVTRQYHINKGIFGRVISNRIYVFGFDTSERETIVALNHEVVHVVLDNVIGREASFTFDFIFKEEFLPVIRKLLGKKLGFIIGVYHK